MTANHKDMANAIRALAMDAVEAAKSGHPGMPMGMADVATVLFGEVLTYDAADPQASTFESLPDFLWYTHARDAKA